MKYEFDGEVYESEREVEEALYDYAVEHFDEYLNDLYGDVDICGCNYSASYALQEVDPAKYRCDLADYSDELWAMVDEIEEDEEV